ncbi:MAG: SMC-Scp complex subunit ScpB, partial [Deltaproteobacteria bacterium]|nr:SMC-Scp complex subunit ScpB [Deltaproteobacteria bacterium]
MSIEDENLPEESDESATDASPGEQELVPEDVSDDGKKPDDDDGGKPDEDEGKKSDEDKFDEDEGKKFDEDDKSDDEDDKSDDEEDRSDDEDDKSDDEDDRSDDEDDVNEQETFRFEDLKGEPPPFPEWMPSAIESLLLVTQDPVSPRRMLETFVAAEEKVVLEEVKAAVRLLLERWSGERRGHGNGLRIVDVGGAYTFYSVSENARFIHQLRKERPLRLSRAALETLSIVAYRQPVTKPQMEEVRGVDCGGAVKNLMERNLVRVIGKADDVGRPLLYGTTKGFLAFFGIRSLHDLPTLRQLQELEGSDEPEALKSGDQGAVVVRDLFAPVEDGEFVSKDTKAESDKAMKALENALGEAKFVDAKVTALTQEDGEIPEDWREKAAAAETKRQEELALAKEVEKQDAAQEAKEADVGQDAKEMAEDALFEAQAILDAVEGDPDLDEEDEGDVKEPGETRAPIDVDKLDALLDDEDDSDEDDALRDDEEDDSDEDDSDEDNAFRDDDEDDSDEDDSDEDNALRDDDEDDSDEDDSDEDDALRDDEEDDSDEDNALRD